MSKPVSKASLGFVSSSVFVNRKDNARFFNVSLQSSYKDEHGEWQNPKLSLSPTEAAAAYFALGESLGFMANNSADEVEE